MCYAALIPIAISVGTSLMQGQQQAGQLNTQAKELQLNAAYLNSAANDARARGIIDADASRVQTQQLIGSQRAAQAASGGVVDYGSNALLQQDAAQYGELDALIISNNAAREAYGYDVQAQGNVRNAKTLRGNAKTGMISSLVGGVAQGLGGAYSSGSLGSMFSGGSGNLGAGTRTALSTNLNAPMFSQAIA